MSATYHTPLPVLWTPTSSDWNSRISDLDGTIYGVLGGGLPWTIRSTAPSRPPEDYVYWWANSSDGMSFLDDSLTQSDLVFYNPEQYAAFALVMYSSTSTIASGGWWPRDINADVCNPSAIGTPVKWTFTNGGVNEIVAGDVLTDTGGTIDGKVFEVVLTSGAWADGNAAGHFWVMINTLGYPFRLDTLSMPRLVDTVEQDNNAVITTVSTNEIRLLPGTYRAKAHCFANGTDATQLRLYDDTADAVLFVGPNADTFGSGADYTNVHLMGQFTITVNSDIELQQAVETTGASFTYNGTMGGAQYGCMLEVWRTAP